MLTLHNRAAHGSVANFVAFNAGLKRHIEEDQGSGHLMLLGQVKQFFPSHGGQRRGIDHAESIYHKSLFYKEIHQGKGLCIESLVTLVVADMRPGPIGGDDLSEPEVALGKCGFPAGRRAAEDNDRWSEQTY